MEFEFNTQIMNRVAKEISEAKDFLNIAVFQIHNKSIYDAIIEALNKGVKVQIFTLPNDSINQNIRETVVERIEKVRKHGANIYYSSWGIGDPERTTTAVGRWYSFHGKFMVTENVAMSLSANLTEDPELDALIVYNEKDKIDEFNNKFNSLLRLFRDGSIKDIINGSQYKDKESLFIAPRTITEPEIVSHWIRDYPSEVCNNVTSLTDSLYIAPFDCRARDLIENVINEAMEYIYISTESFTDTDIIPFLISNAVKNKKIKILTGSDSQDFNERIRELYPRLMANNIELRKPKSPLHAKLIITDKRVVVSSVNLNKMNLGYAKTKALWRANTETITVESNYNAIKEAKRRYDEVFDDSIELISFLSQKEVDYAKSIFMVYGVKADRKVQNLFSQVIVKSDIKMKKDLYQIGKYASILIKKFNKNDTVVDITDFLSAMTLYYLSDRKHTEPELREKLTSIYETIDDNGILEGLLKYKLITKEEEFYKLDLVTLLGETN
ncbi:phospholipase D-like domain-containing protein [Cuniculiplasma sp. SKW4]|uniref:phospholipase D-like domain-containing protein n=1 Tax=Cuniculiplasma sp. SKW4 TaxID=3400171 RepID=UPI003FCFB269